MNHKFREFFNTETYVTPCLLIDVNTVENNYNRVNNLFGDATVYYAVKANSASNILKRLTDLNGYFDAASIGEIRSCLSVGVDPSHISYGNTIKKETDIAEAYKLGVRVFGFDSENELSKAY